LDRLGVDLAFDGLLFLLSLWFILSLSIIEEYNEDNIIADRITVLEFDKVELGKAFQLLLFK
jgi:hypothetical protein